MLIRTAVFNDSRPVYALVASQKATEADIAVWLDRWPALIREWHVIVECAESDSPATGAAFVRRIGTPAGWECRAEVYARSNMSRKRLVGSVRAEAAQLGCPVLILDGQAVDVRAQKPPIGRPRG